MINLDFFTEDLFDELFPYAAASCIFTGTKRAFWDYQSLVYSIKWMNCHGTDFHGFPSSKDEFAAYLANLWQETGDPSLLAPYPWLWPKIEGPSTNAGGLLNLIEGSAVFVQPLGEQDVIANAEIIVHDIPLSKKSRTMIMKDRNLKLAASINTKTMLMPGFGLGTGSASFGVEGGVRLCAVSDDGTLHFEQPVGTNTRGTMSGGVYCNYSGRGGIQLSYNYNYSCISMEMFGDYRLVKYPNLIVTTHRTNPNLIDSKIFGFPGPNPDGNNVPEKNVLDTTPPARMLAHITAIAFWMKPRSGRKISCHDCMKDRQYGITSVNMIVNNQSGLDTATWAARKIEYYKFICKKFGIKPNVVSPSKLQKK